MGVRKWATFIWTEKNGLLLDIERDAIRLLLRMHLPATETADHPQERKGSFPMRTMSQDLSVQCLSSEASDNKACMFFLRYDAAAHLR